MIIFTVFLNFNIKNEMPIKKNKIIMTIALGITLVLEFIWIAGLSSNWWNNEDKKTDFSIE